MPYSRPATPGLMDEPTLGELVARARLERGLEPDTGGERAPPPDRPLVDISTWADPNAPVEPDVEPDYSDMSYEAIRARSGVLRDPRDERQKAWEEFTTPRASPGQPTPDTEVPLLSGVGGAVQHATFFDPERPAALTPQTPLDLLNAFPPAAAIGTLASQLPRGALGAAARVGIGALGGDVLDAVRPLGEAAARAAQETGMLPRAAEAVQMGSVRKVPGAGEPDFTNLPIVKTFSGMGAHQDAEGAAVQLQRATGRVHAVNRRELSKYRSVYDVIDTGAELHPTSSTEGAAQGAAGVPEPPSVLSKGPDVPGVLPEGEPPKGIVGTPTPAGGIVGAVEPAPDLIWARPLSNAAMTAGAFIDNWGRKIAKTPGIRQAMSLLDPAALVNGAGPDPVNTVGRGILLRNRTLDVGDAGTQAGLALLQERKIPFVMGRDARVPGLTGAPAWYDVFDNPARFHLTPEQADYVKLYQRMIKDATALAQENGINIRQLNLGDERNYIPRLVDAIRGIENPKGGVGGRVGAKQGFQKTRFYDWAEEGVNNGVVYSGDPVSVMQFHVSSVYRAIADKRLAEEVAGLGQTILERVEAKVPGLLAAREISKKDFGHARALLGAVNRAYRGERLPPGLIRGIEQSFPTEAAALRGAGPDSPLLQPIEQQAKLLMQQHRQQWQDVSLRVGRLKDALQPRFDEGTVPQPVFQGRIFPKEVSDKLNQGLGDKGQEWLRGLEKVNYVSRTLGTIFDFGAPFIQGLPVLGRDPKAWAYATMKHYQAFLQPESFARYKAANQEALREMAQHGVNIGSSEFLAGTKPLTDLRKFLPENVQNITTWLGKQTGGRFQESFGAFLDAAAIEEWKALRPRALREGPDSLFALADVVNHLRGTMSQRGIGIGATQQQLEGTFMMFAPRYTRAGFAMIADAVQGGVKGQAAREGLLGMAGTGVLAYLGIATAMTAAGLMTRKELEDNLQPIHNGRYNTRFMTVPVGTDNVGFGSFYYGLLKLIVGTVDSALNSPQDLLSGDTRDNPLLQYATSRLVGGPPVTSLALELGTRSRWNGEKLTTGVDYAKAVGSHLLPFWAESYFLQEPQQSGEAFLPSVTGLRVFPDSYGKLAQEKAGELLEQSGLPDNRASRRLLEEQSPELQDLQRKADEQSKGYRKNPVEQDTQDYYAGLESAKNAREQRLKEPYQAFAEGRISGKQLREARSGSMTEFAGAMDALQREHPLALVTREDRENYYRQERIQIKNAAPEDVAAEGYYSLEPPMKDGIEDMSAFFKARTAYLKRFDAEMQDYILHKYPSKRFSEDWMNKIEVQYHTDQETLRPYWAVADTFKDKHPRATEKFLDSLIAEARMSLRRNNKAIQEAGALWYGWKRPQSSGSSLGIGVTGVQGVTGVRGIR